MTDTPQVLLAHHLKTLKLPTFLREYDKLARQCATEGADHVRYLVRLAELELIDRERRMVERRIRQGVGLVWKIQVIDLVRFWCRDGRPKTAIRDNGPLQGRILSRRQGRAGEGGNAPHRQKRYDAVS